MISFRQIQLKYDLLGQELSNTVVKSYSVLNTPGSQVLPSMLLPYKKTSINVTDAV